MVSFWLFLCLSLGRLILSLTCLSRSALWRESGIGGRRRFWVLGASACFPAQLADAAVKICSVFVPGGRSTLLADGSIALWPDAGAGSGAALFPDGAVESRTVLVPHCLPPMLRFFSACEGSTLALCHDSFPPFPLVSVLIIAHGASRAWGRRTRPPRRAGRRYHRATVERFRRSGRGGWRRLAAKL